LEDRDYNFVYGFGVYHDDTLFVGNS